MHASISDFGRTIGQMVTIDATDAKILLARDAAPDASLIDIASRLGVSRNTVHARLKRIRDADSFRASSAALVPSAIDRPLLAFVSVSVSQQEIGAVYAAIAAIPEVIEAHTVTGDSDLMLRVVARDTVDLHRVTQSIQSSPGVHRSSTSIATTEVIGPRMAPLLQQRATGSA